MDIYWWGPHMFGWIWVLPVAFVFICLFFLFSYLFRGTGWFSTRRDRRMLDEAAREILDRRYARGEINREEYEEMRRVLAG